MKITAVSVALWASTANAFSVVTTNEYHGLVPTVDVSAKNKKIWFQYSIVRFVDGIKNAVRTLNSFSLSTLCNVIGLVSRSLWSRLVGLCRDCVIVLRS
jgi:hypothetical protein